MDHSCVSSSGPTEQTVKDVARGIGWNGLRGELARSGVGFGRGLAMVRELFRDVDVRK